MMRHSRAGWGAALALLTVLAGCSGGDDGAGDAGAGDAKSPLAEYLPDGSGMGMVTAIGGGGEDGKKIEELVATCMKEQGFDYTPMQFPDNPQVEFDLDNREWVAQYGYGITTADAIMPDPPEDPNAAKVEAMSPAERKAWDKALIGSGNGGMAVAVGPGGAEVGGAEDGGAEDSGAEDSGAEDSDADGADGSKSAAGDEAPMGAAGSGTGEAAGSDQEPQGCLPKAAQQVHGDRGQIDQAEFTSLFDDLAALRARIDADPRVVEVAGTWSDCLADAGYPGLSEVDEAQDSIMQQWADLNGWDYRSEGAGAISVQASDSGDEAKKPDPAKTAELKKQEIALALADHDCRGDYQQIHDQVQGELEKQFVADHLDELERYRDVVNGVG